MAFADRSARDCAFTSGALMAVCPSPACSLRVRFRPGPPSGCCFVRESASVLTLFCVVYRDDATVCGPVPGLIATYVPRSGRVLSPQASLHCTAHHACCQDGHAGNHDSGGGGGGSSSTLRTGSTVTHHPPPPSPLNCTLISLPLISSHYSIASFSPW